MPRRLPHLVSVEWLLANLDDADLRLVDVRWRLGDPGAGRGAYALGHLPGSVFADLDRELAGPPGEGGRHPLPSAELFADAMERLGICERTKVVAYDDQGGLAAARLWWLLHYFGHETGAVLDGGIAAWVAAGQPLDASVPAPARGYFRPVPRRELLLDRQGVADGLAKGLVLLDARAPERYRGEVEPIDARAGHIPGATNAPFAENLIDGHFRPPQELAARFRTLGVGQRPTAVYCGSGITACHDLLAMAVAGLPDGQLYAGSWSAWTHDPSAPVAAGPEPGELPGKP